MESPDKRPLVQIPLWCHYHQLEFVRRLHIKRTDPWQAYMVIGQMLQTQWVCSHEEVSNMADSDSHNLTWVLNRLGCTACYKQGKGFYLLVRLIRKVGFEQAAKIARAEVTDPNWPIKLTKPEEPQDES